MDPQPPAFAFSRVAKATSRALLRVTAGAHNALLDLEELEQRDLDRIRAGYARLAAQARADLRRGLTDTGAPDIV